VDIIANCSEQKQAKKVIEFCDGFDIEYPILLDQIAMGKIKVKESEADNFKYGPVPLKDLIKKTTRKKRNERRIHQLHNPIYRKPVKKLYHFFSKNYYLFGEGDDPCK
jgi:hypothetical protein